jgi:hypothetical protein
MFNHFCHEQNGLSGSIEPLPSPLHHTCECQQAETAAANPNVALSEITCSPFSGHQMSFTSPGLGFATKRLVSGARRETVTSRPVEAQQPSAIVVRGATSPSRRPLFPKPPTREQSSKASKRETCKQPARLEGTKAGGRFRLHLVCSPPLRQPSPIQPTLLRAGPTNPRSPATSHAFLPTSKQQPLVPSRGESEKPCSCPIQS